MTLKKGYREELKPLNGQRLRFRARIERFGTKKAYRGWPIETMLLADVCVAATGQQVTDHLWFRVGTTERRAKWARNLAAGMVIEFDARVDSYWSGYCGRREDVYVPEGVDYHLERPTRVAIVQRRAKKAPNVAASTPDEAPVATTA
jgi:hypothetical protein